MVGDNYRGFRIVGTEPQLFTEHAYGVDEASGAKKKFAFAQGELFDPLRAEAVVGSFAAQQLGFEVGSTFYSYHGLSFDEGTSERHNLLFTVVGVLEPTNTPADRVIWIPLEGYFRMPGHALGGAGTGQDFVPQHGQPIPDEHKEVSAVLITIGSPQAGFTLDNLINRRGREYTFVWPVNRVMADLFNKFGWAHDVLTLVAVLVVLVAAGSILASIYNPMNERRREFAILRALGARRTIVSGAIVTESAAIAALGALLGFAVYGVLMAGVSAVLRQELGLVLDVTRYHPAFALTPVCVVTLGALTGIVPAIKAYATDVATNLSPTT
jgi:putative ABC transport system permease protein